MARSRAVGLLVGVALVLYFPVVTVWAVARGGAGAGASSTTATTAATSKGARAASTGATAAHGTKQVLHVAVPGSPGTTREVFVYRPAVPDSADLPVLYLLHGDPGTASDAFTAGLPALVDQLVAEGYPPFVLAVPDGNGTTHPDTEWANAVDGTDQFETFVTSSVIRAVEGTNLRDRSRRAIAGFSMGGYGAMNLALRHPELYSQVVPIAGYFHVDDTSSVFGHELAAIDANTPELHLANARRQRILVVDGDQGGDRVVSGESQLFYERLVAAHVPASYLQTVGTHSWAMVASVFPDVVRFLDAEWSTLQPPVPEPSGAQDAETTGAWQGTVSGAHVDVALVSPHDPRVARLESTRVGLGAAPTSYVVVTLTNPATALAPVSLFKVSFVAAATTVDANPEQATVDEWITEATRPSAAARDRTSTTVGRSSSDPRAVAAARLLLSRLGAGGAVAAPGATTTVVLVTTAVVRDVSLVFVGDSFGVGSLDRTR